jgi:DNA-binding GntR family transcriptional regulator
MSVYCTKCRILSAMLSVEAPIIPSAMARKLGVSTSAAEMAMLKLARQGVLTRYPPAAPAKQGFTYAIVGAA